MKNDIAELDNCLLVLESFSKTYTGNVYTVSFAGLVYMFLELNMMYWNI